MKPTSVFKWLFITFILITIPFICIEYVNIATSAPLLKNHIRKSLQSACDYYSAETYMKSNEDRYNLPNIYNSSNDAFVSGSFYGNLSKNTIYNNIMQSFRRDLIDTSIPRYTNSATTPTDYVYAKSYLPTLQEYADGTHPEFSKGQITPANLGITHIDEDITLKIFKYNLASTLIGGNIANLERVKIEDVDNPDTIDSDPNDANDKYKNVVRFNGFEVDIDNVTIYVQHAVTYVGSKYYELATGLDSSKINNSGGIGGSSNGNAIVAEVSYNIPVRYVGITPMKRAVEWIWSNDMRVHGTKSSTPTYTEMEVDMDKFETIESGQSSLNLIDKIYYTIVD